MKKTLLVALVAMLWLGCKKNNSSLSIVGKWYLTTDSTADYTNGTLTDHATTSFDHTAYAMFNSNGSGTSVAPDGNVIDTIKFNYTLSGKSLKINYPTQVVEGGSIQGYSQPATVTILTSSKLEIQESAVETDGGNTYKIFEQSDFSK